MQKLHQAMVDQPVKIKEDEGERESEGRKRREREAEWIGGAGKGRTQIVQLQNCKIAALKEQGRTVGKRVQIPTSKGGPEGAKLSFNSLALRLGLVYSTSLPCCYFDPTLHLVNWSNRF